MNILRFSKRLLVAPVFLIADAWAIPQVEIVPVTPGTYAPGERVVLELHLSQVNGLADLPLRLVQFDFEETSPALLLDDTFEFDYSAQALCRNNSADCGEGYAEFTALSGLVVTISAVYKAEREDLVNQLVLPRSGTIRIGSFGVTLPTNPGEYRVDVINPNTTNPLNWGAQLHYGFETLNKWLARDFADYGDPRFVSQASTQAPGFAFVFTSSTEPVGCTSAADCNDGNPCTSDSCTANECLNTAQSAACDDGNACTTGDMCVQGGCTGQPVAGCCMRDADCDDGDAETIDRCVEATCEYTLPLEPINEDPPPPPDDSNPPDDGNDGTPDSGDAPRPRLCGIFGMIPGLLMITGLGLLRFRRRTRTLKARLSGDQTVSRAKDGHPRLPVDRATAPTRAASCEFHSGSFPA